MDKGERLVMREQFVASELFDHGQAVWSHINSLVTDEWFGHW